MVDYLAEKKILPTKNGLSNLLTVGFDDEQIWEQLQTYYNPLLNEFTHKVDVLCGKEDNLTILREKFLEEDGANTDDMLEEEQMDERALRRIMSNEEVDDDEQSDNEIVSDEAVAEDNFMPEEDIEKFITKMEEDLDVLDDKEFDEEENKEDRKVYKELYGDSLSDEESEEEEPDAGEKTLFQKHQEELLETIEKMENENIKEKEWQKKGEIIAKDRPVNSLLEDDLIFEHQSKSKPIITEEVTIDLESIIISRIVAGIFDDPEKPDIEDKKENAQNVVNLQHEKSKKSLAEIYEEMYLKKVEGKNIDLDLSQTDPKIAKERNKIKHMMANTLYMLNKLSSFNYVAPPIAEFETVEDGSKVKPIDVKTTKKQEEGKMAPQEIVKPIRELPTANAEITVDERKRKRREVKEKQAKKTKKAKELVDLVNPTATGDKEKNEKLLKQLKEKEKNNKSQQVDPNASSYSSSKRFFELMQEKSSKYSSEGKAKKKDKHKGSA